MDKYKFNLYTKYAIISLLILSHLVFYYFQKIFNKNNLSIYLNYINDCYNLKQYKRTIINNEIPFVSICLPCYNMQKYIESTILSIINQSFQDFEIIIINDFSNDDTLNIINNLKLKYNQKIKIINHIKNLGVYASRVDGILNSSGKYIILMDCDDMLFNYNLLKTLYIYNLKYNLDIIEFKNYNYIEKTKKLIENLKKNHYHNFSKKIIHKPELSDILFYNPSTKNYSSLICTSIWTKIIRKEVLIKAINYIGTDFYKEFVITAEDTLISLISFQFSNNYSNIEYPGYMYNIRKVSMTHGKKNIKKRILFDYSYYLYLKKLYFFIKDFDKDRNFLFYELKRFNFRLLDLRKLDKQKKLKINQLYNTIKEDKKISNIFKNYLIALLK